MHTNIAQASGTQHSIANGMQQYVGIAMAYGAFICGTSTPPIINLRPSASW